MSIIRTWQITRLWTAVVLLTSWPAFPTGQSPKTGLLEVRFEDGLKVPYLLGQAWPSSGTIKPSTVAHGGKQSLEVCAANRDVTGLNLRIPVSIGTTYALSGWVRLLKGAVENSFLGFAPMDGGTTYTSKKWTEVRVVRWSNDSLMVNDNALARATSEKGWQPLRLEFEAERPSAMIFFGVDSAGPERWSLSKEKVDTCVLFDDIVVEDVPR